MRASGQFVKNLATDPFMKSTREGGGGKWRGVGGVGEGAFLLDFSYRQLSTPSLLHTWMLTARSMAVSHHTIQAKFSRSLEPRSVKRRGVLSAVEGRGWVAGGGGGGGGGSA